MFPILVILALMFPQQAMVFDPDGYYLPQPELRVGKYEIQSIGLDVVYSPTHTNRPPSGSVQILRAGQDNPTVHFTRRVIAAADTLFLEFHVKQVGVIRFAGSFIDKRGSFGERGDINPDSTIVLSAKVSIEKDGHQIYSKVHKFTYFVGD